MAKAWEEQVDLARSYLDKAAWKMKKFADRKRRPMDYQIGDRVMVKLNPRQFKSLQSVNQNLIRKYEGPFEITAKVGKISYRVDMPHHLKKPIKALFRRQGRQRAGAVREGQNLHHAAYHGQAN